MKLPPTPEAGMRWKVVYTLDNEYKVKLQKKFLGLWITREWHYAGKENYLIISAAERCRRDWTLHHGRSEVRGLYGSTGDKS